MRRRPKRGGTFRGRRRRAGTPRHRPLTRGGRQLPGKPPSRATRDAPPCHGPLRRQFAGRPARRQPALHSPAPTRPRVSFRAMRGMHALLARNRLWAGVAAGLEASPGLYRAFTAAEKAVKSRLFGCRMCAQCALPSTAYACPMTCPKQLRNGPCGGVALDGSCEVYPGTALRLADRLRAGRGRTAASPTCAGSSGRSTSGSGARAPGSTTGSGRDEGLWTKDADPRSTRIELPMLPSTAPAECATHAPDRPLPAAGEAASTACAPSPAHGGGARRRATARDGPYSLLHATLRRGRFAVTAEIGPPQERHGRADPPQGTAAA